MTPAGALPAFLDANRLLLVGSVIQRQSSKNAPGAVLTQDLVDRLSRADVREHL